MKRCEEQINNNSNKEIVKNWRGRQQDVINNELFICKNGGNNKINTL